MGLFSPRNAPAGMAPLTPDILADLLRELNFIAYAGVPLTVSGFALGAFCVIDNQPRTWSYDDVQTLKDLGECAMREIELNTRLREVEAAWRDAEARVKQRDGSVQPH